MYDPNSLHARTKGSQSAFVNERLLRHHFAFGKNWKSFLSTITPESITEAERGLTRLLPPGELRDRRFLDVGCGSGLSMLAAIRLGASQVTGIDLDPLSVETAQMLLSTHAQGSEWSVRTASVFDLNPTRDARDGLDAGTARAGEYDIVYSWGVLHHTGDVWGGIEKAASMVAPGGHLALALYRHTPLCGFWKREKRFYAAAPGWAQRLIRVLYKGTYALGLLATRRSPLHYVREYRSARGMDWHHDVHDWLGGYPYQSVEPQEVTRYLAGLGLSMERVFARPAAARGLFGTHCDEYVAVRNRQRE